MRLVGSPDVNVGVDLHWYCVRSWSGRLETIEEQDATYVEEAQKRCRDGRAR